MNALTRAERESMLCDLILVAIAGLALFLFFWNRDIGPALVDNPCWPSQKVTVNGKHVGCTNDEQSPRLWRAE